MVTVPDRCTGSRGFHSHRELKIFLCPMLMANSISHVYYFFPSLKFTICLSLLTHTVLSTLLTVGVCRMCVTCNEAQWLERPTSARETILYMLQINPPKDCLYVCYPLTNTTNLVSSDLVSYFEYFFCTQVQKKINKAFQECFQNVSKCF